MAPVLKHLYIKLQFNTNICFKRQILCSCCVHHHQIPEKRGMYVYDAASKVVTHLLSGWQTYWICPGQSKMATRWQIPTGSQGCLKCPGLMYFGKTSKNFM